MVRESPIDRVNVLRRALRAGEYASVILNASKIIEEVLGGVVAVGLERLDEADRIEVRESVANIRPGSRAQEWGLSNLVVALEKNKKLLERLDKRRREGIALLPFELLRLCARRRNDVAHPRDWQPSHDEALAVINAAETVAIWATEAPSSVADDFPLSIELAQDLTEAASRLEAALRTWPAESPLVIRVLGLTLYAAWEKWETILGRLARGQKLPPIRVELAMLDPEWEVTVRSDSAWLIEARSTLERLPVKAARLVERVPGLSIRLWTYRAHPAIHGALVGERYLAGSLMLWMANTTSGKDQEYLLAQFSRDIGTDAGGYLIRFFQETFSTLTSGPPVRQWGTGAEP